MSSFLHPSVILTSLVLNILITLFLISVLILQWKTTFRTHIKRHIKIIVHKIISFLSFDLSWRQDIFLFTQFLIQWIPGNFSWETSRPFTSSSACAKNTWSYASCSPYPNVLMSLLLHHLGILALYQRFFKKKPKHFTRLQFAISQTCKPQIYLNFIFIFKCIFKKEDSIHIVHESDEWSSLMDTAMNLYVTWGWWVPWS